MKKLHVFIVGVIVELCINIAAYGGDLTLLSDGHPTKLAHLIAEADHVVFTNRLDAFVEKKHRGFSLAISGDKAHEVVRAISSAKPCAPCDCIYTWNMKFYRTTNLLAEVQFGGHFIFEGQEYYDESGVLERLESELNSESLKQREKR